MINMPQIPTHGKTKANSQNKINNINNPEENKKHNKSVSSHFLNKHICTYNMRTYRGEEEKPSEGEIPKTKYDIIGLSDTKYQGEHLSKLKGGHTPYICGNFNNHRNDVELLRSRRTEKRIIST